VWQFTSLRGRFEFASVGDDKIFHLFANSQNEGPGVGYRGLFLPKGLSQTWAAAYLKLCSSETFGHPTKKAPLCRVGGLGAPPRRGRIGAELVFFWGGAYLGGMPSTFDFCLPTRSTSVPWKGAKRSPAPEQLLPTLGKPLVGPGFGGCHGADRMAPAAQAA
jgi:hypothetical protein